MEEAVYRRLIDHYYDTEAPIGADYGMMIRRLRLENYQEEVQTILKEFFAPTEKGWVNKHCDEKIKAYKNKKKVNKTNGKSGGRPKKPIETDSVISGLPVVTLTTNNKQETKNNNINHDLFDVFWKQYPKKVAKPYAFKVWKKINPSDELLQKMLSAINTQGLRNKDIQFVPNPATWLNGERWEDEVASKQDQITMGWK